MKAAIAALDAAGFAIVKKEAPPPPDVVGVLEEVRNYILDFGADDNMAPVIERIESCIAQLKGEGA
jgi:hypothetical protein